MKAIPVLCSPVEIWRHSKGTEVFAVVLLIYYRSIGSLPQRFDCSWAMCSTTRVQVLPQVSGFRSACPGPQCSRPTAVSRPCKLHRRARLQVYYGLYTFQNFRESRHIFSRMDIEQAIFSKRNKEVPKELENCLENLLTLAVLLQVVNAEPRDIEFGNSSRSKMQAGAFPEQYI